MIGEPVAVFVVERQPGQGYCVASSRGSEAESLREQALRILDELGQPDPRGPEEIHRWFGPVGSRSHFVGVAIKRLASGEVSYTQAWFSSGTAIPATEHLGWRTVLVLVIFALVGGVICGWFMHAKRDFGAVSTRNTEEIKPTRPLPPAPNSSVVSLKAKISEASDTLEKIRKYFQQERLLPKPNLKVVERSPSIRLQSNLSFGSLDQNYLDLDNVEVRSLLDVFNALQEWSCESSTTKN